MALPNWYRRCIGCGEGRDKRKMLRIVKNKGQAPELDLQQKKPGRGAYVCPNSQCVMLARKKRGLERSFRCSVDDQIYEKLIQQVSAVENRKS
ncbi:hypothetical protein B6D60_02735 [candidate division KSB1 bacterium 4484_87]|nr:MAG: hypothetical protein B6D60_02735 [candidate division KSB1 bacterium 4484_87]